jgi:hypothetical protein
MSSQLLSRFQQAYFPSLQMNQPLKKSFTARVLADFSERRIHPAARPRERRSNFQAAAPAG